MAFAPLSWVRRALSRPKKPDGKDPRRAFAGGMSTQSPSLNGWTDSRIDQVRAYKHWVYIAVTRIADRVAMQAPNVGQVRAAEAPGPKRLGVRRAHKALAPLWDRDDLVPAGQNHPLVRLLNDPNDPDTGYDVLFETVLYLLLTGNAYWWIPKNALGMPAAIWVLPAHWVWPKFVDGIVVEYEIRPVDGNYLRKSFPANEVIHFRKKSPVSKIDGYSPQTAASQWIDTQLAVDRHRWFTHKNGAFPSAALEFDPQVLDPNDDDLARIEAKFLARYAGETRAGKPLLLPPGVKYHKLSVTPKEMDFCDSAEQLRDNILATFGVPHVIAGIAKDVTATGVLAAHSVFCSIAVNPLCRYLGGVLSEKMAPMYRDETLRVWWDDTTPDDPEMVEKQLKTDMSLMARTPNEVRALRGLEPYQYGGNDPILPNVGLVMPWGTGQDVNTVNPFTHELGSPKDAVDSKAKPKKPVEDE